MKEITGDIWDFWGKPNYVIFITTNASLNRYGNVVMGRGTALQAKRKVPHIDTQLAEHLELNGNHVGLYLGQSNIDPNRMTIGFFPVKHKYYEYADLELIRRSANELKKLMESAPEKTAVITRPGCGNGRLFWHEVKPVLESVGLPDNVLIISPMI